jgi:centromere protein C
VQGSAFRYAKVMTMPFFGAGMVEVPPEGYKRTKNSRKMQMIFFVHEGKVTVEVGDIKFGMSKGGVWQVPRGTFLFPSFVSSVIQSALFERLEEQR